MTKKLLFVTTILLVLAIGAFAADVNGKYVFEQAGRNGTQKVTLTLKTEGGKLTGNVSQPGRDGAAMETPITEGTINGDNIAFKTSRQMGDNTFVTSYAGTVAGDEIKLKVTRPGRGGGDPTTTEVVAKKATT
jgi:autotransporter translocation and assembly factor TamB